MTSVIQDFEADFLWKVGLKMLNSGMILKTFTHALIFTTENVHNLLNSLGKHVLWCSEKAYLQDISNEYPQHMFSWCDKKNSAIHCSYPNIQPP